MREVDIMRKTFAIILAMACVVAAVALVGCGKTLEGSCDTVVKAAQDVSTGDNVKVKVSGSAKALAGAGEKDDHCMMTDGPGSRCTVYVSFDGEVDIPATRFTVDGTLYSNLTSTDLIHVNHAKIVQ